jgi:hypothetical protein
LARLRRLLLLLAGFLAAALLLARLLAERIALLLLVRALVRILVLVLTHPVYLQRFWLEVARRLSLRHPSQRDNAPWFASFLSQPHAGTRSVHASSLVNCNELKGATAMGRYALLWMIGVPLPILFLIYVFGGLH